MKIRTAFLVSVPAALSASSAAWFTVALTVHSVGRGVAAAAGLDSSAPWGDRIVAAAFGAGGWGAATFARAGIQFLISLAIFMIIYAGVRGLCAWRPETWMRRFGWAAFVSVVVIVGGLGVWGGIRAAAAERRNLTLVAPVALIEKARANGGRVFWNPSMLWDIAAFAPEYLGTMSVRERAAMMSSPVLWRDADREDPASAVLIGGRVAEAQPLIEHLLGSPDWRLEDVDNEGILFLRGEGPDFSPPPPERLGVGLPEGERAFLLARTAINYQEADLKTAARSLAGVALDLAPDDPSVLVCSASVAAAQGRWERVRASCEKALKFDPGSRQARYLLALSLLETGVPARAFDVVEKLTNEDPDDYATLFLYARVARAVRDPGSEIRSLEALIRISEKAGLPAGGLNIYLGQAWAQKGFPDQALAAYRAALASGLTPGEEADVREAIGTIEENRLPPPQ